MVLIELIKYLESKDPEKLVPIGFCDPHSYRGSYCELAFEKTEGAVSIGEMLRTAKSCIGTTFIGYKGGEYTMSEYTTVHIAEYGCCGEEIGTLLLDYMCGEIECLAKPV